MHSDARAQRCDGAHPEWAADRISRCPGPSPVPWWHSALHRKSVTCGLHYTYDLSGRRTQMQLPTNLGYGCTSGSSSGCMQTYKYDTEMGALDTVTSIFGNVFKYSYDSAGRLSTQTGPGGASQTWTYDPDSRVARRLEQRGTGTPHTVHADTLRNRAILWHRGLCPWAWDRRAARIGQERAGDPAAPEFPGVC
jgi:YD repeat-containing protein